MHIYWDIVHPQQLSQLAGTWTRWRRIVNRVSWFRRWYWRSFSRTAEGDSVNLYSRSLEKRSTR